MIKEAEITAPVGELVKALNRVKEVMPKRNRSLPIAEFAHLVTADGKLSIYGGNLEQSMAVDVKGAKIQENCNTMLPVRSALTFLNGLMHDRKNVEKQVYLKLGEKTLALEVPDVGDLEWEGLPDIENFSSSQSWDKSADKGACDGVAFLSGLKAVSPALALEDTRPVLRCIGLSNKSIVAADGFRLHVYEHPDLGFGLPDECDREPLLLPSEAIRLLLKLFKGQEKPECRWDRNGHRAWFEVDNMRLATNLGIGSFPNWRQLIPTEPKAKITFSAPVMVQRLDMLGQDATIVRIAADPAKENGEVLKISSKCENRKWNLTMPVKTEAPEKAAIAFNQGYLRDAVKQFSLCTLSFTSPSSPGVLTGDVKGLTIVVMPMFVQWP